MEIQSTSDVPVAALRTHAVALPEEWGVEVDERQIFFKSLDVPSWVAVVAQAPWWLQFLAASASVYVTGIISEAGKDTWRNRGKLVAAMRRVPNAITRLAEFVIRAKAAGSAKTYVELAIPFPDKFTTAHLRLNDQTIEEAEFAIALFIRHIPALQELWASEGLLDRGPVGGAQLRFNDDLSLTVTWIDPRKLTQQTRVIGFNGNL